MSIPQGGMPEEGLEPPTRDYDFRCSNRLSYSGAGSESYPRGLGVVKSPEGVPGAV